MIEVKDFVTWLKSWFYGIEQVDDLLNGKANKNLGAAGKNVVTDSSGVISLEDKPTIDSSLSSTSTNAVQNKVIKTALDNKAPISHISRSSVYGLGEENYFGHTKVIDDISNETTYVQGRALSAYRGKMLASAIAQNLDMIYQNKSRIDGLHVTVEEQSTADSGYAKTYIVKQGGTQVGSKINIPKDFLVKSASVKTVTTANTPVNGYVVGDKYLDFIVNSKDGSATDEHLYVLVSDLVDTEIEWSNILNKPSSFTPASHTHSYNDLTNKPTIDSSLNSSSTNAVQNKVINAALENHTHDPEDIFDSGFYAKFIIHASELKKYDPYDYYDHLMIVMCSDNSGNSWLELYVAVYE